MAITNGYATLAELKARLDIPSGSTQWDTVLEACVTSASRWIDEQVDRTFYAASATRYFTPDDPIVLFAVFDLQTVTTIRTVSSEAGGTRTYGYTWSATDYDLEPYHGPPYTRIVANPTGLYTFPLTRRGVEVVGTWGYNATGLYPPAVNEACLRQSARLFERNKGPMGTIGGGEMAQLSRYVEGDPDAASLLRPYRRIEMVTA